MLMVASGGRVHGSGAGAEAVRGGHPEHREQPHAVVAALSADQRYGLLRLPGRRGRAEQGAESVSFSCTPC